MQDMPHRTLLASTVTALALALAACAKTGEPQPPRVLVPKPPADLAASQHGDRIVLTVSMPSENTDGTPANTVGALELLRSFGQGTAGAAAEAALGFDESETPLFVLSSGQFPQYLRGRTFVLQDDVRNLIQGGLPPGTLRYAVRFTNRRSQTAGLSNVVAIRPLAIPPAPDGLRGKVAQDRVALRWNPPSANADGSRPPRVVGYNVYRSEDAKSPAPAPLNEKPLQATEFEDRSFQFDRTYYYAVSVVANLHDPFAESDLSTPVKVEAKDVFAPSAPLNLNGLAEDGVVILLWAAPPEPDVAGYRVYRRQEAEAQRQLLQQELVTTPSYRDQSAPSGRTFVYSVTAVDGHGNEGPAAEVAVALPETVVKPTVPGT